MLANETADDLKIVASQLKSLENHMNRRFDKIDKELMETRSMITDGLAETRSIINTGLEETRSMIATGLNETRSEIQGTRRFSFALFCFALNFSAISMAGLLGKIV
jgi:hypothetical protein